MHDVSPAELTALSSAFRELAHDFAGTLRGHAAGDPVPHLEWTVGDLGRHVLSGTRDYLGAVHGQRMWDSFDDGPAQNLLALQRVPEQEPQDIADALPEAVDQLLDAVVAAGPALRPWHADVELSPGTMLNLVMADMLIHRWDLERVGHRNADHVLPPAATHLAIAAPLRVASHFLTPAGEAADVTYELRIRGGTAYRLDFHDGALVVEEGRAPDADCRLSANPRAFVLVGYGRRSVVSATGRGSMMAFGRKPWLALRFASFIRNP